VATQPPEARVVRSRAALAEAVARWPESPLETTWALVAVSEVLTAPQMAALRYAAKTCDKVAAVVLPAKPEMGGRTLPNLPQTLRAAGADMVWVPAAEKPLLNFNTPDGATARLMLQAALAVLPSHVVAARTEPQMARLWKLLASEFGGVVDVVLVA
jgi:hypothetical protein